MADEDPNTPEPQTPNEDTVPQPNQPADEPGTPAEGTAEPEG